MTLPVLQNQTTISRVERKNKYLVEIILLFFPTAPDQCIGMLFFYRIIVVTFYSFDFRIKVSFRRRTYLFFTSGSHNV